MMEEGGDGNGLGDRTIPGSEEEDTLSVRLEPSVASSISDSSSIASATDEFSSFDTYSETGTPSSVARPALTVSVGVPPAVAEPEVQGSQASSRSGGGRSVFLTSYVPLWGRVSICGRRPEMEDAVVAVPRFFEIPLRMLTSDCFVDGMDSPTTNEPCTRRKTDGPFALFDIPSFIWLLIIFFFPRKDCQLVKGRAGQGGGEGKTGAEGLMSMDSLEENGGGGGGGGAAAEGKKSEVSKMLAGHPFDFHVSGPHNLSSPNWKDLIHSSWFVSLSQSK